MADNKNRLESILSRFDADWTASDEARREAKNDLFFSRVSQWDDWLSQYTTLQYRGQFDVVPRFYVSTSKSIIKALINMHSF
ncbi:portal protein, partial [Salmonella enterica subsp. enterica serovar Corvallis]